MSTMRRNLMSAGLALAIGISSSARGGPSLWESVGNSGLPEDFGLGIPGSQIVTPYSNLWTYEKFRVARDPEGRVYVAWSQDAAPETGDHRQIYLSVWDGVAWREFSEGSASGMGVSACPFDAFDATLDFDDEGNPWLAWVADRTGATRTDDSIYVRRWNGSAWVEVFPGSASGDGLIRPHRYISFLHLRLWPEPTLTWRTNNAWGSCDPRGPAGAMTPDTQSSRYVVDSCVASGEAGFTYAAIEGGQHVVHVTYQSISASFEIQGAAYAYPQIATDGMGHAYLSFTPLWTNGQLTLLQWNGSSWVPGPWTQINSSLSHTDLAVGHDGEPVFASNGDVWRWSGSAWVRPVFENGYSFGFPDGVSFARTASGEVACVYLAQGHVRAAALKPSGVAVGLGQGNEMLGGISRRDRFSLYPSVAVGPSDELAVAWAGPGAELRARRWDGAAWANFGVGPVDRTLGEHRRPTLVFGPAGQAAVVWWLNLGYPHRQEHSLRAQGWDGQDFAVLGGGPIVTGTALSAPAAAYDANGDLVVAWIDSASTGDKVFAARLQGDVWQGLGCDLASAEGIVGSANAVGEPALTARGNTLALAWRSEGLSESAVHAVSWSGGTWAGIGSPSGAIPDSDLEEPCLVLDSDGRAAVLGWTPEGIGGALFDGTLWEEFPTLETAPNGRGEGNARLSAAAGLDNTIVVAWTADWLRLARWNGSAWEEMGDGSMAPGLRQLHPLGWGGDSGVRSLSVATDARGDAVVAFPCFTEIFLLSAGPGLVPTGDANGDSLVDVSDAVRIDRHLGGDSITSPRDLRNADVSRDRMIDETDREGVVDRLLGAP